MNHNNHRESSIQYRESSYLRAYKALHLSRTLYKSTFFMQNKPNFRKSQMNANTFSQMAYENIANWTLGENKPNSNPNKPNFRKAKMNVNLTLTKDYRKYDDFAVQKNKPNSNPISVKPKMNVSIFSQMDYENKHNWTLGENKPNQTQFVFLPSSNEEIFISKTVKKSCARLWALLQCFLENFDKPGERKAECSTQPKLRNDPMNLLGTMPAKEGKIDLKHSFHGSAFVLLSQKICEIRG